jgi:EamA-like transporter family
MSDNSSDDAEQSGTSHSGHHGNSEHRENSTFHIALIENAFPCHVFDLGFFREAISQISFSQSKNSLADDSDSSVDKFMGEKDSDEFDASPAGTSPMDNTELQSMEEHRRRHSSNTHKEHQYTHTDMMSIAIILCPLWFLANCCYNYSLLYTSVASSTVISNLSGGFTLFFSWLYGVEKVTTAKLVGLGFCFVGVAMTAMGDKNASSGDGPGTGSSILGDSMAVFGAAVYGLYTTVLRVKVADDESGEMQLLLGYMGLVNAVIFSPILLLMVRMCHSLSLSLSLPLSPSLPPPFSLSLPIFIDSHSLSLFHLYAMTTP